MRLGDLDALFCRFWGKADPFKEQPLVRPCVVWSDAATMAREAPAIDPEALPIVRQLREELANKNVELHEARESCEEAKKKHAACAQKLKQTQYCYDIAKNAEQQLVKRVEEITGQWAECAKRLKSTKEQLERVTVQRDEAVRDADNARQSLMMAMFAKCEFLVKFDRFGKSVQIVRRADEEEARP